MFGASEPSGKIYEIEFPPTLGVHLIEANSVEKQLNEFEEVFTDDTTTIWRSAAEIATPLVSINAIRAEKANINEEEVFPPFYPDLEAKHHPMQQFFISNLDNTRELEFDHEYINEMIEKFTIHPNQCNKCNDLSKVFHESWVLL